MPQPRSTPATRESRASSGAGTAQATRKNRSTPFAPVATLRPITVDSETHRATTNSSPAAAKVCSDTAVPSATSAAAIKVASTYARAWWARSPPKSATTSSPIAPRVANTASTGSSITSQPR